MRLDINLASQPYEDARQFWLRWGAGTSAVGILTLALVAMTVTGWFTARRDRATIARLNDGIAQRDAIRKQAEDFLNRPENRTTRDESQVLNELIERKSFSWTRVLEDLEKVMPARVHLVSINPNLDDENELALKMVVAGDSRDKAIELAQRMDLQQCRTNSPSFDKLCRELEARLPQPPSTSGLTDEAASPLEDEGTPS